MNNRLTLIHLTMKVLEKGREYFVKFQVGLGKKFLKQLPK